MTRRANPIRLMAILIVLLTYSILLWPKVSLLGRIAVVKIDINLESIELNNNYNNDLNYSNFTFSFLLEKNYAYIASVNGTLFNGTDKNNKISLNSINQPPAIGLEGLKPINLYFGSPLYSGLFDKKTYNLALNVNFQLFVTSEDKFGSIVTQSVFFNNTLQSNSISVPEEAMYYSVLGYLSQSNSTTSGFPISAIFLFIGLIGLKMVYKHKLIK